VALAWLGAEQAEQWVPLVPLTELAGRTEPPSLGSPLPPHDSLSLGARLEAAVRDKSDMRYQLMGVTLSRSMDTELEVRPRCHPPRHLTAFEADAEFARRMPRGINTGVGAHSPL
jgi:hypothetical protein